MAAAACTIFWHKFGTSSLVHLSQPLEVNSNEILQLVSDSVEVN